MVAVRDCGLGDVLGGVESSAIGEERGEEPGEMI